MDTSTPGSTSEPQDGETDEEEQECKPESGFMKRSRQAGRLGGRVSKQGKANARLYDELDAFEREREAQ